jgi:hypothetical protein
VSTRRIFTEDFHDLPRTLVPDWDLLAHLNDLFLGNTLRESDSVTWYATDARGVYESQDFADFRKEAEQQERPPHTIRLTYGASEDDFTSRMLNVYISTEIGSGGRIASGDETVVNHVATRVRELFEIAAQRVPRDDNQDLDARYENVVIDVQPVPRKERFWRRHADHIEKWALAVVPVVLGVLLTLWLLQK